MNNGTFDVHKQLESELNTTAIKQQVFEMIFQSIYQDKKHRMDYFCVPCNTIHLVKDCNPGCILDIKNNRAKDLIKLKLDQKKRSQSRTPYFAIDVDYDLLNSLLNTKLNREDSIDQKIKFFIKNDASTSMLCSLFGINRKEVTMLKKKFGVKSQYGRPRYTEQESDIVITFWEKCLGMDEISKYLYVAEKTNLSLKKINCIVQKHNLL